MFEPVRFDSFQNFRFFAEVPSPHLSPPQFASEGISQIGVPVVFFWVLGVACLSVVLFAVFPKLINRFKSHGSHGGAH